MGPDSWAYWEGSVSLLEKGDYSYFGGQGITAFPPLFSCVLALFQAALGVSVLSQAISLAAFVTAGSFAWAALYVVLSGRRHGMSFHDLLALLYVPASLAIYAQTLLSEALWLVLVPILLLVIVAPAPPDSRRRRYLRPLTAWLILSSMLLCRNATVSLLPAVFLLFLWLRTELALLRRFAIASVVIAGSLIPWYWVRMSLGQLDMHRFGSSGQGILEHSRQMAGGLAYAFGPNRWLVGPVLLCCLCVLIVWEVTGRITARREDRPLLVVLVTFAALGLAGLVGLFSVIYVGEPLAGRFVVFAALPLGLVTIAAGEPPPRGWRQSAFTALGVLLTAIALYRVGIKYLLAGREQPVAALNVTISSSYWLGPARTSGAYLLVAPPTFPWQQRGRTP